MIVDSSAIVAVLREEAEALEFAGLVEAAQTVSMSAPTYLETSLVLGRSRQADLEEWLTVAAVDVVAFDREQARVAQQAHRDYGRGSGSPARLNVGDCFSYALARVTGRPLLFKGDDFGHTDVVPAHVPGAGPSRR